jgi:Glyoxalase-like domain
MPVRLHAVCLDTADPVRIAAFWAEVLGWTVTESDPDEVAIEPPPGSPEHGVVPELLFLKVPEPKPTKNRLHLDLRPVDQAG